MVGAAALLSSVLVARVRVRVRVRVMSS